MAYLKLNGTDFSSYVSGMKCDYETLLSDKSGRSTASGNAVVDIIARKWKIECTFIPMTDDEMSTLLNAIGGFVFSMQFLNPKTKALETITAYTGTPTPEYYTIQSSKVLFKPMSLSFIQM